MIAFLGYVLPYGQMSLWGATVITNLLSAIPWIGQDFVQLVYETNSIYMSIALPAIGTINWGSRRRIKS